MTQKNRTRATGWAPGNLFALEIPAQSQALRMGGESFLTQAFHVSGALAADNEITRITQFDEFSGGSTGRKLLLSVEYAKSAPGLHKDLFVKFSRDFDDAVRDRGKIQMESEIRFAALSRSADFPIAVPVCLYADYDPGTGTGALITQRIDFGSAGIEKHIEKCLDYAIPNPLEHYKALTKTLARLAGAHKAGRLPPSVETQFPFDMDKLSVAAKAPYTATQLEARIARYADFANRFPQLLPPNIRSAEFLMKLAEEAPQFLKYETAMKQFLQINPDLIALCHWNANFDNAWFWRDASGELQCGLIDWGHVSQMNVAMALWGMLSAAEIELWDNHLGELLAIFITEFGAAGGPLLDQPELKFHLQTYAVLMGLAWLLDPAKHIPAQIADLSEAKDYRDPRIASHESMRAQLHMMRVFLNLWQTQDFGAVLERFRRGAENRY